MSTLDERADGAVQRQRAALGAILDRQRQAFLADGPPGVAARRNRIDRLMALVLDNTDAFVDAMAADFGTRSKAATLFTEVVGMISVIEHTRSHVAQWMRATKLMHTARLFGLPALAEGLGAAGRQPHQLQVIAQAMVAVARTEDELGTAVDGVASLIAFYGSTPAYRPVLEVEGWEELQPELNRLSKVGKYAEMRSLITDPMVRAFGIVGAPEECAEQIRRRFGKHASEICCYFPGYTPKDSHVADLVGALHRVG
jgi:alkanesulfonate monooxygenase SsuD/methylene tetrahydromethanopterin reductase-like flavin-dependent oxidoreductase (luciferase family)